MVACNRTIRQVFLFGPGKIPALFYFMYRGRCLLTISPASVIVKNTVYLLR